MSLADKYDQACAQRDELRAEVERLRAERDKFKDDAESYANAFDDEKREVRHLRAEISKCPCNLWHEGLVADLGRDKE
jgi:uncharacterized coiled-coil DUF342 family protein